MFTVQGDRVHDYGVSVAQELLLAGNTTLAVRGEKEESCDQLLRL